jgi:hypothetical protein
VEIIEMAKKQTITRIYDLGIIPILVRTKKDCKKAGDLVQKMALKTIKEGNFYLSHN